MKTIIKQCLQNKHAILRSHNLYKKAYNETSFIELFKNEILNTLTENKYTWVRGVAKPFCASKRTKTLAKNKLTQEDSKMV